LTEARAQPFAPGSHRIVAHGAGAFAFAGMKHEGSILATPAGVRPLQAATLAELTPEALRPLFEEKAASPDAIEFLVIGVGASMAPVSPALKGALRAAGLRFDAMATGPALRVYNIMQDEGRRVAAALLAAP